MNLSDNVELIKLRDEIKEKRKEIRKNKASKIILNSEFPDLNVYIIKAGTLVRKTKDLKLTLVTIDEIKGTFSVNKLVYDKTYLIEKDSLYLEGLVEGINIGSEFAYKAFSKKYPQYIRALKDYYEIENIVTNDTYFVNYYSIPLSEKQIAEEIKKQQMEEMFKNRK